jgi:release factor glutamine methyltransferase
MKLVHFLGVEIETGPGALIPRAETALLGRTAIAKLHAASALLASSALGDRRVRFVDVCCGTGNLACALAAALPGAHGFALDLTDGCVALARANVGRLGFEARVTVLQGDLFAPLVEARDLDVIVCNPPYISSGKLATRDDLRDEPREAFDGGPYGIAIHQRVAREAVPLLRPGGWLTFELGHGQERQLELVLGRTKAYDQIELVADEAGATRVIAARKRPS